MNIREKLVELIYQNSPRLVEEEAKSLATALIANNVMVQETAYWKEVLDCGVGNCFGICSNCRTQHKANSYGELMTEHRYCRWCGARLLYEPTKGE